MQPLPPPPAPEEEEHTFHPPGWPGGEPEQIREAADNWIAVADGLQAILDTLRFNVDAHAASWAGGAKDSFATEWTGLANGIEQALPKLREMATAMRTGADQIEEARDDYKQVMIEVGAMVALGVAFSFVTFGGSGLAAGAASAAALARAALLARSAALAARAAMLLASTLARTLAIEFTVNFAVNMGAQVAANATVNSPGEAFDGLDYRNALIASGLAAPLGPLAGPLGRIGRPGTFSNAAARTTFTGAGEAGADAAGQMITTGQVDPVQVLFAGSLGVGVGGVSSSRSLGKVRGRNSTASDSTAPTGGRRDSPPQRYGEGRAPLLTVEPGATLTASERAAADHWVAQGHNVRALTTASDKGIHGVRTADLEVEGVGLVDVYSPAPSTSANNLVRAILNKNSQTSTVHIEIESTNVTDAELARIPNRVFGNRQAGGNIMRIVIIRDGQMVLDSTRR